MAIQVKLSVPDELLEKDYETVSRGILERFVLESYKLNKISAKQVRNLLGFASRLETEDFLHRNRAFDYSIEDLEEDLGLS